MKKTIFLFAFALLGTMAFASNVNPVKSETVKVGGECCTKTSTNCAGTVSVTACDGEDKAESCTFAQIEADLSAAQDCRAIQKPQWQ